MCDDTCDVDILSLMSLIMSMIYFVELDERGIIYSDSFLHHYFLYLFYYCHYCLCPMAQRVSKHKEEGGGVRESVLSIILFPPLSSFSPYPPLSLSLFTF